MCDVVLKVPRNKIELSEALSEATEASRILAGGTDLIISLHKEEIQPDLIIDVSSMRDLRYIKEEDGYVRIGAATTVAEINECRLIEENAKCLQRACEKFGSTQIRNRATIGGNIANASPAGDLLPPLMALDADVSVLDKDGNEKYLPLEQIMVGPGKTSLSHEEAIVEVRFRAHSRPWKGTFVKLGTRRAVTISRICLAVNLKIDDTDGLICDAKIALGAVGKTAYKVGELEKAVQGEVARMELREKFAKNLSEVIQASIPGRASLPYKKYAIEGVVYQAFEELFEA